MKNQKGITLIALVVTIIVLLILAGISIAMLTGDNGIITRTNDSKMSQIEGQVKEEIKLAVQSAKIFATQKSVETSGGNWFAANISTTNKELDKVVVEMRKDLTRSDDSNHDKGLATSAQADVSEVTGTGKYVLNGYCVYAAVASGSGTSAVPTTITVTYSSPAYQSATNEPMAHITATITVEENNFTLATINAYRDGTTAKDLK